MRKAREAATLEFDGVTLSFIPDLVKETLDHCLALKPLTDKLRTNSINYRWGFIACLIANRDGRVAILRFPEDLEKFCIDLNISPPELPGWQEDIPMLPSSSEVQWQKVSRKQHSATPGSSPQMG